MENKSSGEKVNKAVETADKQPKRKAGGVPFTKDDPRINREGRKEGSFSVLTILKRQLQEISPKYKGKERKIYAELLVEKQLQKAIIKGDDSSIRLIYNYIEGMPKQSLEIDNPAQVEAIKSLENIIKEIRK